MPATNPRQKAYEAQAKATAKATPKTKVTPKPNPSQAMDALIKEREAYVKKYGYYPSDEELMKSRKSR